jgi:glycerol-3-phosphate dehydrogenase
MQGFAQFPGMIRDLERLTSRRFDVLVIGGGICGLMAAWDAATRGLHVALVDRHDFAGGASFHHHRTLHGGLRYLQTLDFARLRESVRERRAWARMAPQFIAPQAFAIQAGGARGKSPGLMQAAFAADAVLTADRNRGLDPSMHLARGAVVGYEDRSAMDTGGLLPDGPIAVWHDYRTVHAERLTFAVARAAAEAGAVLANYMDVVELLRDGTTIIGAIVRDGVDNERWQITARVIINATGAAAGRLMAAIGVRPTPLLVKALNLVTRRPSPAVACGAPTSDGRLLFALPCHGKLSIGTWHGSQPCGADAHLVTPEELDAFLAQISEAFPDLQLTHDDIALVQRGVVPATLKRGRLELADRPLIREHRQDGVNGAVTLMGVKYTTARAAAEYAVTLAMAQLGTSKPSRTASLPLPGMVPTEGSPTPARGLDSDAWQHLQRLYGTHAGRIASMANTRPDLAERIVPELPVTGLQIVDAARHEMALTLEDVILRRTSLGSAGYPGDAAVLRVEALMRDEAGWSSTRAADEMQLLKEFYLPLRV